MSGRVPSSYGSWPGTRTDQRHVPLGQTTCFFLSVACCLPTCAQGLSVPVMEIVGNGVLGAFWLLFCVLCAWEVLVLLVPLLYRTWVTLVCLLLDTPFERRSVGALPL